MTVERLMNWKDLKQFNYEELSIEIKNQIDLIIKEYDYKFLMLRQLNIRDFITYNVSDDWIKRLYVIKYELHQVSQTPYSCEIRYGEAGKKILEERLKGYAVQEKHFIRKYGEEEGKIRWLEFKENDKKPTYCLKHYINKYGEEEGKVRWDATVAKKIETERENFKNKKRKNGQTLEEYQDRYGLEFGYQKWNEKCVKLGLKNKIAFFISKYGEEEGKIKWEVAYGNMNKTSIKAFIERYGEEEGKIKYNEFTERLIYTQTIEYYIERYGEEEGRKKRSEYLDKVRFKGITYSKVSQELFWEIYKKLNKKQKNQTYFAELNEEYFLRVNHNKINIIFLDFKLDEKIIEFDGEYWHRNSKEKDDLKDELLIEKGYQVLRIKELEYYKNKKKIVNKCLKFLKNE